MDEPLQVARLLDGCVFELRRGGQVKLAVLCEEAAAVIRAQYAILNAKKPTFKGRT